MGLSNITRIKCDYVDKEGKPCGKTFLMPDEEPEKNTPGSENTVSIVIAAINKAFYFCSMLHLVAFAVAYMKATPKEKKKLPNPGLHVVKPTQEQIAALADAGMIGPADEPTEDLSLKDE